MQDGVLEELHSLNTRLGRLMPPPAAADQPACGGPQDRVVEAKPSGAWALRPPESLSGLERRVTRPEDALEAPAGALPEGLRLWQPTDRARRLAVQARHDLEALYRVETARDIGARLPALNTDLLDGGYALFGASRVLYGDALRLLSPIYRSLARLCDEYERMACLLYGVPRAEFRDTTHFSVTRIQPGRGVALASLAARPHMGGPIATATLGPVDCLFDVLAPPPAPSARLALPEGTLTTLDGHARLHCRFGEPEGSSDAAPRYRITFLMSSRRARVVDRQGPVLVTPIRADCAVVTRALPACEDCPPSLDTPVLCALHDMHARLQVCESRLCMERHERSFAEAHRR